MREVCCSKTRGKRTVFGLTVLISMFVGGPLWIVYGTRDKLNTAYSNAHWLEVGAALIPVGLIAFIFLVCWRALFMWMMLGIREWTSGQDWVIEITHHDEINFERPTGTQGESYLIKLSEISAILKETELGTMDSCDTTRFFVICKNGKRFLFDNYIPLDVESFFKKLVKKHPSIDYSENET